MRVTDPPGGENQGFFAQNGSPEMEREDQEKIMDDEAKLEQRLNWIEEQVVAILTTIFCVASLMMGATVYWLTVESFGGLPALGCAVVAFIAAQVYLVRHHFGRAPEHIARNQFFSWPARPKRKKPPFGGS